MDPPVRVTDVAVFVIVPPPHCGVAGVPEIFRLAGIASVKSTPVKLVALLLVSTIDTVLTPFKTMLVGAYALVPVSAGLTTILLVAGKIFVTPG
jgi:hypothetical protein